MIHQNQTRLTKRGIRRIFGGIFLVIISGISWPATGLGEEGYWWGSAITPGYNRKTVIQVEGTVKSISLESIKGMASLILETDKETYQVMVAPDWYLMDQKWDIRNGDSLKVVGSRMTDSKGKLFLVAAHMTNQRTDTQIDLRDEQGNPLWKGKGERSPRRYRR